MSDMSYAEAIRILRMEDKYPFNADRPQLRQALRLAIGALKAVQATIYDDVQAAIYEDSKPRPKRFARRK